MLGGGQGGIVSLAGSCRPLSVFVLLQGWETLRKGVLIFWEPDRSAFVAMLPYTCYTIHAYRSELALCFVPTFLPSLILFAMQVQLYFQIVFAEPRKHDSPLLFCPIPCALAFCRFFHKLCPSGFGGPLYKGLKSTACPYFALFLSSGWTGRTAPSSGDTTTSQAMPPPPPPPPQKKRVGMPNGSTNSWYSCNTATPWAWNG